MNWIIYSLIAIGIIGVSDLFRKLASGLKDPFFTNLVFQIASVATALLLFLLFSRKTENNSQDIYFAILGRMTVSMFSLFSFKALYPSYSGLQPDRAKKRIRWVDTEKINCKPEFF